MNKIQVDVPEANTFPQYVLELGDVFFGKHGTILDQQLNLVPEANLEFLFWTNLFKDDVPARLSDARVKPVLELPDDAVYLFAQSYFNTYVFGHLWDTIQALKKVEDLGLKDLKLVISAPTKAVKNVKEHFSYFGYPVEKLVINDGNHRLRVKRALYSSPHCLPSRYTAGTREWMRNKYMFENPKYLALKDLPGNMHLYLSRGIPTDKPNSRGVNNEAEVWDFLQKKGFVKVTGEEVLMEHIRLFKDALVIVGPHGSMFKNTLFCQQSPVCYEFCPANRRCRAFEDNALINKHRYAWIPVLTDGSHHITIPMEVLKGIPFQ